MKKLSVSLKNLSIEKRIAAATLGLIALLGVAVIVGESGTSCYELAILNLGPFAIPMPWLTWEHWRAGEGYIGLVGAFILFISSQLSGRRARIWIVSTLSATTLLAGILSIIALPVLRPQAHDIRDQMLYYLGAKYYDELGYENLTRCLIEGAKETGVKPPDRYRDQSNNHVVNTKESLASKPSCRHRFSIDRWDEFKQDTIGFTEGLTQWGTQWQITLLDHGFNGSPVLRRIISTTANIFPATHRGLSLYGLLNLSVVFLAFFAILAWVGWRESLVCALLMFVYAGDAFSFYMSIPRYFWISSVLIGVALLYRGGRWAIPLAGALLVLSASIKIFPGAWLVGPTLLIAATVIRRKKIDSDGARFLIGGAIAAGVLFIWTVTDMHYFENWTEFVTRMRLNGNRATTGCIGFAFNFLRPVASDNNLHPIMHALHNPLFGPISLYHIQRIIQVLLSLAVLRACLRLDRPRAAMLSGFGLMFIWTVPMRYYYTVFLGLPMLFPHRQGRTESNIASIWLLLSAGFSGIIFHHVSEAILNNIFLTLSFTAFLFASLITLEIQHHRRKNETALTS